MTEQELKARIRKRIHRELGVIPDWVWEHYWNLSVVCEYLEGDTGSEPDIMGEDGGIYVNQMKTVLETLNTVTQHNVPSFSLSRNRQQPTPREEMLRLTDAEDIEDIVEVWQDVIELWWNVLPERDKQAITQVWEFAYNSLDAFAPTFRERYAGKRTLTPEESRQWFMDFFSAEAVDTILMPTEMYLVSDIRNTSQEVCCDVIPFSDETRFVTHCKHRTRPDYLLWFLNQFAEDRGMTLSIVLRALLTGERTPPRLVVRQCGSHLYCLAPEFPPYLSAEGVARVWSTVRFSGSPKSWSLSLCNLRRFRSYNEALQAWNRVTPEEWRIRDYRTFRREWKRAQERAVFSLFEPQSSTHPVEQFAVPLEWKFFDSVLIGGPFCAGDEQDP
jgi:hypothetical protein